MSKLGIDGKPIYNEHGKVMKGPNYFKPDLNKFIDQYYLNQEGFLILIDASPHL